jgi:hypothetical protein
MTDELKNNGAAADVMSAKGLRTPRAAAIAGIVFAVLISVAIVLFRISMPTDPADAGQWLSGGRRTAVMVAVNLIPFAGMAFLWFIGVLRHRLGEREDKFFATVFLGSGLLFVAMLFTATAMIFGLLASFNAAPSTTFEIEVWNLGSRASSALLDVFSLRMAAVFLISSSTVFLRTGVIRRWIAFLGLVIALVLLVASSSVPFINLLLPLWIFLVSMDVLIFNLRQGKITPAVPEES